MAAAPLPGAAPRGPALPRVAPRCPQCPCEWSSARWCPSDSRRRPSPSTTAARRGSGLTCPYNTLHHTMAQVKLLVVLVAVLLASCYAEVIGRRQHPRDEGHVVSDSSSSDSSDSAGSDTSAAQGLQDENAAAAAPPVPRQSSSESEPEALADSSLEQNDDNEALPPFPRDDLVLQTGRRKSKVYAGQQWENLYKHGVAPAKLPARESDNAHRYRHSIIHPYGDDVHA